MRLELTMDLDARTVARFRSQVEVHGPDDCWPWKPIRAKRDPGDKPRYWYMNVHGRRLAVHRIAFFLANGTIDPDLDVLHSCDNPPCCNDDHLRQGTHRENMEEMTIKGRRARTALPGEANGRAVLTLAQVLDIRRRYVPRKVTAKMLAKEHGVSEANVRAILEGRSWKDAA